MLPGRTLPEIFEARSQEAQDRVAVFSGNEQITYGDLNRRADSLAGQLAAMGAGPETLIGLCVERKIDLVVGVLGILKAGAAYVPIDPAYPAKRIEFLCADSGAGIIVAESATADRLQGCKAKIVCVDRDLNSASSLPVSQKAREENLAYVIYTSGSTGTPKGVQVEHRQVVRLFEQLQPVFGISENDIWTLFHSISFDFSVWEIWGALLYGGSVVIVPSEMTRSPHEFHVLLREKKVTILNQTPSAFRQLLAAELRLAPSSDFSLRSVILAGETLDVKMLEPWIARYGDKRPDLMNIYGITETTVHTTYKRITAEDLKHPDVSSIGIPISDLQAHLFDPNGKPVPDGTPGEIYVSGAGLARGYLNRPELTAQRFLTGPPRMYRTGDRAVRMSNGELAFLGRIDDQIKVRGFRIEPKEVELCLSVHDQVESAIVAPHDYGDGDIRLVAYIVPRQGLNGVAVEQMLAELGQRAGRELPLHMRPSAYFLVPEIPMTANGKVDREALKKLAVPSQSPAVSALITPTEQVVTGIWQDILEKKQIGVKDDFFDLGGTSLALIRIFARVNEQFHLALNGSILVEEPTVSRLAHCVDEQLAGAGKLSVAVTPTEQAIVQIWEDILQRKNIGVRDDFFDIGGTSLALIRIFAGVNAHFDLSLNGSILAEEPTVSRLARCVDAELKDKDREAQIQAVGRN